MTRIIDDRAALLEELASRREVFMVYDIAVEAFAEGLADDAGIGASLGLDVHGQEKTMDTVLAICAFLLESGADRDALVLAVGGGTLTDMAGFAASIYKRGVSCAYVPTTLLAQVDAALGGKTGVNLDGYKNILGTFSMPEFLYYDIEPLRTLPLRQLSSGFAELLKTFIIADAKLYRDAVNAYPSAAEGDFTALLPLISAAARIKTSIVEEDPNETGKRRVLNLGHTFAHAIEWYEQTHEVDTVHTHGEAVAMGIIAAAKLSAAIGLCRKDLPELLATDFQACSLPVEIPYPNAEIEAAFPQDKKSVGGVPRFVLIRDIGKIELFRI